VAEYHFAYAMISTNTQSTQIQPRLSDRSSSDGLAVPFTELAGGSLAWPARAGSLVPAARGGKGASHATSRNTPPAANMARMLPICPSEPKSSRMSFSAAATSKNAPSDHNVRDCLRVDSQLNSAPIVAQSKETTAGSSIRFSASTVSVPGGPISRNSDCNADDDCQIADLGQVSVSA
jgi:hypothetical protein